MSKEMLKEIYHDATKHSNKKIQIITNHLKLTGTLLDCDVDEKDEDCFIDLADAKLWRIEDICTCQESDCKCNDVNYIAFDEIHINMKKIIAFSLSK